MLRKRKIKKLYGVTHFYTDSEKRFEFYYRRNWLDQFDVMVWDIEGKTNRWFMVTAGVFFTMLNLSENLTLSGYKDNIQKAAKPKVVNEYIHNHEYTLLVHKVTKLSGDSVVGKLGKYGPEDDRRDVLLLKRVASIPEMEGMVLGMDTMEIPVEGVVKLVKDIRKRYFKDVEIIVKEDTDGTN